MLNQILLTNTEDLRDQLQRRMSGVEEAKP